MTKQPNLRDLMSTDVALRRASTKAGKEMRGVTPVSSPQPLPIISSPADSTLGLADHKMVSLAGPAVAKSWGFRSREAERY